MLTDRFKYIDDNWFKSDNMLFQDQGPVKAKAKTRVFATYSRHNKVLLGHIKWMPNWRQYTFFPLNSIFDKKCLRELADFCELKTHEHREEAAAKLRVVKERKRRAFMRETYGPTGGGREAPDVLGEINGN